MTRGRRRVERWLVPRARLVAPLLCCLASVLLPTRSRAGSSEGPTYRIPIGPNTPYSDRASAIDDLVCKAHAVIVDAFKNRTATTTINIEKRQFLKVEVNTASLTPGVSYYSYVEARVLPRGIDDPNELQVKYEIVSFAAGTAQGSMYDDGSAIAIERLLRGEVEPLINHAMSTTQTCSAFRGTLTASAEGSVGGEQPIQLASLGNALHLVDDSQYERVNEVRPSEALEISIPIAVPSEGRAPGVSTVQSRLVEKVTSSFKTMEVTELVPGNLLVLDVTLPKGGAARMMVSLLPSTGEPAEFSSLTVSTAATPLRLSADGIYETRSGDVTVAFQVQKEVINAVAKLY
jgi:hypothetical protein